MSNIHELLEHLEYAGGGYYRDSRIPKGENAPIVHGPELLNQVKGNLLGYLRDELLKATEKALREKLIDFSPIDIERVVFIAKMSLSPAKEIKKTVVFKKEVKAEAVQPAITPQPDDLFQGADFAAGKAYGKMKLK